ncbi:D-galactonate dehydratase family protein [Babesia caballi]|uniref:D-galactonate dehydratase family protein n=1 Tax=Babesia caballi TaxID=5871 RepID=A0AAV4LR14_BABCB|nr:D-galactonate dehydratase family protein [Babesia caballi]
MDVVTCRPRPLAQFVGKAHWHVAHGSGTSGQVTGGIRWVATAEARQIVGEECLERGRFATLSNIATMFMFAACGVFTRVAMVRLGTLRSTYPRLNCPALDIRVHISPKCTRPPTTSYIVSILTLLMQEVKLKLQCVCIFGKLGEQRRGGLVCEAHAVGVKFMKERPVKHGWNEQACGGEVFLQVTGRQLIRFGRGGRVGNFKCKFMVLP